MSSKLTAGYQSYGEDLMTVETTATAEVMALDLDGVDDYVSVPDAASLRITDYLSFSAWVYCGEQTPNSCVGARYDYGASDRSWFLATDTTHPRRLRFVLSDDGTYDSGHIRNWETTNDVLPASGWAHVVLRVDTGVPSLFVDGTEITALTKTTADPIPSITAGASDLPIGELTSGTGWNWDGKIFNASIWHGTGVLSAADISALYNSGTPVAPDSITPTGGASLVSSWLWNTSLPDVPGAGDIPDNTGSNDGSTAGSMTASDVVDSGFTTTTTTTATVAISEGFYEDDDAFATALETAIQATFPDVDVYPPASTRPWEIKDTGGGTPTITWGSENARTYMGYAGTLSGASSYVSDDVVGSTWFLDTCLQDPTWGRTTARRSATDHTGHTRSAVLGRYHTFAALAWIAQDEADNAYAVLLRFLRGARGKLRIDSSNSTAWAWSAAGWGGEMTVSLLDPSGARNLGSFLTEPWSGIASVRLQFVRW